MGIEENKEVLRHAFEIMRQKELDTFFEILDPGYIAHFAIGDLLLEQYKQFETMYFAAFPDASATIEEIVAEGDKVAIRVTWRMTHKGEFMGIAPTENKIEMTNTLIFRIAFGKLVENWATVDEMSLWQQLGFLPSTEEILKKAQNNTN